MLEYNEEEIKKIKLIKSLYVKATAAERINIIQYLYNSPFTMKEIDIYNMIVEDDNEDIREQCLEFYCELGMTSGLEEEWE